MSWKQPLADLIYGLENTQFPFASIHDDLTMVLNGLAEIKGSANQPVRHFLEQHVQRIIAKHQRCMGVFTVFHALLVQQARAERDKSS